MATTFAVDDVVPAGEPAATVALRQLLGPCAWIGGDPELRVLDEREVHPLLGAVHHAFVGHRPLVLSPDAVWLTIAQGVAQHIRMNEAALRPRLVRHAGKQIIDIPVLELPRNAADWASVIAQIRAALARAIGDGRARLLTCDFSTTTEVERVASEIVLIDAMAAYFEFRVTVVCGIPRITLTGTPADWRALRARIDALAELDLATWCASLAPIADRLVAAAEGRPDIEFFRRIYKPRKAYGWDRVTGWIARLYPYLRSKSGDYTAPNPLLTTPLDHQPEPSEDDYYGGPGILTSDPPVSPSRVLVRVADDFGAEHWHTIEGGLIAIEQDAEGRLVPRAGYFLRSAPGVATLIERLVKRGAQPAQPESGAPWAHDVQLHALFEAIDTVQLGAWRLLPAAEHARICLAEDEEYEVAATRVVDVGDGSVLAVTESGGVVQLDAAQLVRLPAPVARRPPFLPPACQLATQQRPDRIPLVAPSLIGLLERALSGDQSLTSSTTLLDVEPELWDSKQHAAPLVERLIRSGAGVPGTQLFESLDELAMPVGDATWRMFNPLARWPGLSRGIAFAVQVPLTRTELLIDLGDGRALARCYAGPVIVVLELAAISMDKTTKRKHLVTAQTIDRIPVVGRNLVEVLTWALDHGQLPATAGMLVDRVQPAAG